MNKYSRKNRSVNLLPLMDVIFLVLAVFFYLMLFMIRHQGIKVELPTSLTSEENKKQFVSISITEENILFIDEKQVPWISLEMEINSYKLKNKSDLVVYIAADKKSFHEYFVKVLDALRNQGITNVNIETVNY